MPESPVKEYDLVTVLESSLHYGWQLETDIRDAEEAGDQELGEWFRKVEEDNKKAGDQGKRLLQQRLQG